MPPKGLFLHRNLVRTRPDSRVEMLLSVAEFCSEICAGVEAWSRDIPTDAAVQARLSSLLEIHFLGRPPPVA